MHGSEVVVQNISKSFGNHNVLSNVSLTIKAGEFFSLLGPSGCGKTTLLRIIGGFEEPESGDILLDGKSVLKKPPNKRHVNTVFQSYALFPHLTVFENVAFALRLKKAESSEVEKKVGQYLELVKLFHERNKKPAQLSGGQKQRVAIARALINEPSVLLLDEPLSALDAKLRQHMLVELDTIHDATGITFIYVTHDQQEALSVSDRVAVINEGKICQIGTPTDIYEHPKNEFAARFIGENNFINAKVVSISDTGIILADIPGKFGVKLPSQATPCLIGEDVLLSIRPEKIHIGQVPDGHALSDINIMHGRVDEIIYAGYLSKYFIDCGNGIMIRVYSQKSDTSIQHEIRFNDHVAVWWKASDSLILKANK